ncbi:hypothetical protein ACFWXI_14675 [[Kitasatospora] papulosa]|uniref:hypothetical protein n=1 Tax=[Kitasatospora] papulosa TaxID=1464011 RepID=UPI0036A8992D
MSAPMTPDSVRTDALQPGDQLRHPHDWTLFTVSVAAEWLDDLGSPLDFHNRETDEFERGMRVTGTDASGETVHVDTAPSYLWHREGQQKTARDELATAVAEHGPFPMPTGEPQPVGLTEEQAEALINAGNGALSDYYHERQCHCSNYPAGCVTNPGYRRAAGFWDTDAFAIGLPAVLGVWESLRNDRHAAKIAELRADNKQLRARVAELEAQRDRRRARLVALQNDALSMRGSLSPNGEASKVPFELGPTLTPAVDWLINRVAELEALTPAPIQTCRSCGAGFEYGKPCSVCEFKARIAAEIAKAQAEDPHDSPLHRTCETGHDLPEVGGYHSAPLPAAAALCATCGHNGAAHHHAGTACWENLPREQHPAKTWDPIRLCPCSVFVEVTR